MNLILLQPSELTEQGRVVLTDRRAEHILQVLKPEIGQVLKVGVLNGPRGTGEVVALSETVELLVTLGETPARPKIDLALALPRPQAMKRLWPQLAAMGIGHLALINANRVERYYFDYHVIREQAWEPLLQEGLEQAGDTLMPRVTVHKQFKTFVDEEVGELFPDHCRVVAEPGRAELGGIEAERVLLVIGPEGGWNDFELERFESRGFGFFGMGERILRSDTACVAGLAQVSLSCRASRRREGSR